MLIMELKDNEKIPIAKLFDQKYLYSYILNNIGINCSKLP